MAAPQSKYGADKYGADNPNHRIEHDTWMTDPNDPDYLPPASRWCRVCGRPDSEHPCVAHKYDKPTASERIREARQACCETCDKPATHLSGIGNGYEMYLCADCTNHRVKMYAEAAKYQPCKQPWFRSIASPLTSA